MTASVAGPIARSAFVVAVCLASSSRATAQQNTAGSSPAAQDPHTPQSAQAAQTARDAQPEYPSLHLSGFADVNFAAQDKSEGPRGFSEGQFVLHLASALSPRVNFFGELSLTPRTDAGTGSPAATGFNAEVERVIIRFDHSDRLKISFGRYHTPINWWNTAFHHGQWLQTTVSRPEMIQFGEKYAQQTIKNAKSLAGALHDEGIPVLCAERGFTASHQVLLEVRRLGREGAEVAREEQPNRHGSGPGRPRYKLRRRTHRLAPTPVSRRRRRRRRGTTNQVCGRIPD